MSNKNRANTMRATLAVTLVIFLSKGMGFLRDVISAGYFATGVERDAYSSAYSLFYLPVLLFNSCITSTLIPLYMDARRNSSVRAANRFASNCINLFAIFSFVVGLLMLALAEPLVHLVYAGFDPERTHLTAQLTQVMMPSLVFVVVSIVMASVLNAREQYLPAQLTGFPLSIALIVATVFFSPRFGIQATAWGVFAAGILQMLVLLPWINRSMTYSLRVDFSDPRIRRMLILAVPAILSMAVNELNHLIDKSIASWLNPGDISAMDYAYRLITFITGVLVVPITTVMFSKLSKCSAEHDRKGIIGIILQCMEVTPLVLMPIIIIGSALSTDVIRLAYMHGKFGEDSLRVTSSIFFYYLVGVLGFAMRDIFNRAFHSMQDTRMPMLISCVTVVLNVVLNLTLSRFMGANGLALATSISCALGAVLLLIFLRKRLGRLGLRKTMVELGKIALASCLCLACVLLLGRLIPPASGKLSAFVRLFLLTATSCAIYLAALVTMRTRQLGYLKGMLVRRK